MKAITFFGKMLSFSRLKIQTDDLTHIKNELHELVKEGSTVPVVIDSDYVVDLSILVEILWEFGIQPIGVVEGVLTEQAMALRLATFPADGKRMESINTESQHTNQNESSKQGVSSVVYNHMLRSGQSLQHVGGDLIVIGGVNKGAEAITDSSLHVYGHGQGRLVAGATGDNNARIFCQKFNPTLVSVAGTYCLSEDIPTEMIDKAVQVSYDETKGLVFTLMTM